MSIRGALFATVLCFAPVHAMAQSTPPTRFVAVGDIGYGQTADDEGMLGKGAILVGALGLRLTERLTLQVVLDRVAYHRDEDWIEFDGRVVFVGAEAAFHYRSNQRVRPYWSIGAGFFNDDGTATWKTQIGFLLPRVEERVERHFTFAAMTASGGIEVPVSRRASIRAGLRFHGLLDTGDDAAPHMMLHPTVGLNWRW
jgi:hypothetical protein